ncbi:hypothetical protein R3P38DRAFT_2880784 [Favolaschia claudopus]|uniref:F-box domain-containing protein n=1 Tax=Favolaschia claudopus TaxID=2862362 RepID=A0AAW0D366_9AGAR
MDVDDEHPYLPGPSFLNDLPVDNIFQILKFCDPVDLFSFGQTNHKFHEITLTRTVWLNALRRICELNSLFVPSFPYDEMSLAELQWSATFGAVPRFTRRLYKQENVSPPATLPPMSQRLFTPLVPKLSSAASVDAGSFKTIDLVPGGRFLLATTNTLLHLCDLGYNATQLIRPHTLASVALPVQDCHNTAISFLPTEDGNGIEVMVMAFKDQNCVVANFHVFPTDSHPEFIPVSETHSAGPLTRGFLAKSRLCVLQCGGKIFVWNTARNLWASWKAESFPLTVFVYQNLICCVTNKTINLYPVPVPHCDDAATSGLENYLSLLTLSHPFRGSQDPETAASSDWYCATSIKPCFIFITGWKGNKRYIARYTMHSIGSQANPNIPDSLPILMDKCLMADASDHLEFASEILPCGGDIVSPWSSLSAPVIALNVTRMPTEKKSEGPPFTSVPLFEYRGDRHDDFDFSVCPFTGRLCTRTGNGNEIIVLDYLIPSWKDEY